MKFLHRLLIVLLSLIVLIVACASVAQAIEQTEKYDNGQTKSRYTVAANGDRSGPYWLFYENGKTQETGTYRIGQLNGAFQQFYENGKPRQKANYKLGKLDGLVTDFDEQGRTVKSAEYRDDQLNGVYREYLKDVPVVERVYVAGLLAYPRSPAMISQTLKKIRQVKVATTKATTPIPRHPGGNASQQDREDAVRLLMEYRYLCYLPYETLALDETFNAHTEAASAILAKIGHLDHHPANPGWTDADYQYAYKGTSSSNIGMGLNCTQSVRAYIGEDGLLGHRRWCLNPPMGHTGISAINNYTAMWAMDSSVRPVPDYDFVAYPAPGYFPNTHFNPKDTWSISFNPRKYREPDKQAVSLTVSPAKTQLQRGEITESSPLTQTRCDVNLDGYGIPNCIAFTMDNVSTRPGSAYMVEIKGLETNNGKPASMKYLVEFFQP